MLFAEAHGHFATAAKLLEEEIGEKGPSQARRPRSSRWSREREGVGKGKGKEGGERNRGRRSQRGREREREKGRENQHNQEGGKWRVEENDLNMREKRR